MRTKFDQSILKKLKKLKGKDKKLYFEVEKKIEIFQLCPDHNSLRLRKLKGRLGEYWSISIGDRWRLIFYYSSEGVAVFADFGTHDQVYKR